MIHCSTIEALRIQKNEKGFSLYTWYWHAHQTCGKPLINGDINVKKSKVKNQCFQLSVALFRVNYINIWGLLNALW